MILKLFGKMEYNMNIHMQTLHSWQQLVYTGIFAVIQHGKSQQIFEQISDIMFHQYKDPS